MRGLSHRSDCKTSARISRPLSRPTTEPSGTDWSARRPSERTSGSRRWRPPRSAGRPGPRGAQSRPAPRPPCGRRRRWDRLQRARPARSGPVRRPWPACADGDGRRLRTHALVGVASSGAAARASSRPRSSRSACSAAAHARRRSRASAATSGATAAGRRSGRAPAPSPPGPRRRTPGCAAPRPAARSPSRRRMLAQHVGGVARQPSVGLGQPVHHLTEQLRAQAAAGQPPGGHLAHALSWWSTSGVHHVDAGAAHQALGPLQLGEMASTEPDAMAAGLLRGWTAAPASARLRQPPARCPGT